ncbi:MAG: hypothetical protein IIC53_02440 [Proteobacteria bacterium]|nr:hypothetical protein [Pseudomonadota bacterium]
MLAPSSGSALGDQAAETPEVGRRAGETATTRRPGDLIVYRFACHDADSMVAIARSGGGADLAAALVSQGKCFQSPGGIAATLEDWIAGPYPPPRGTPARGGAASGACATNSAIPSSSGSTTPAADTPPATKWRCSLEYPTAGGRMAREPSQADLMVEIAALRGVTVTELRNLHARLTEVEATQRELVRVATQGKAGLRMLLWFGGLLTAAATALAAFWNDLTGG